jgi:hypothetical protein
MKWNRLLPGGGGAALALAIQCASANAAQSLGAVLESGNPGATLTKGYTTMETATVQCNGGSGCMLSMRIMSNIGNAHCTGQWAIVGLIDGNSVDGGPFQDVVGNNQYTHTGTWQGAIQVGEGTHTVTFQLNVPCTVKANQWSVRYLMIP